METFTAKPILRSGVFLAIIFNVFFNLFYGKLFPELQSMEEVSETYYSFFTPAPYTFMIWSVIYIAFIAYGLYQLLSAQRDLEELNKLAWPMIIANILCSVWIVLFSSDRITESVGVIILVLICAIVLFLRAEKYRAVHPWLLVPFSLFFGWMSVATLANISTWLTAINRDGSISLTTWTTIMMFIAFCAALIVSIRFKNIVYPLVIAWALTGIWVANAAVNNFIAYTAMILVVALLAWLAAYFNLDAFKKSKVMQKEHSNHI
jgi:hypothetical protein